MRIEKIDKEIYDIEKCWMDSCTKSASYHLLDDQLTVSRLCQTHAKELVSLELPKERFVECKSGECSTCAAPVFHGPLDYEKEGE